MQLNRRRVFVHLFLATVLLLTAATSRAGYRQINRPNPADKMAVHIYRLDNGLTVYLTENHEAPRFYAEIATRAGSKEDPAESTGLAHYLEHMLFKGTQQMGTLDYAKEQPYLDRISELYEEHFRASDPARRKAIYAEINHQAQLASQYEIPNEIDKLYKAMGGTDVNAHTSNEETVYQVDLPSNRLQQWAVIESERFRDPVFRLFQPELEIVYEEKNRTLDNKEAIIDTAVNKVLYKHHPYGQRTTIGEVKDLKNPSLKNMYHFYQTYYVPNNMAIAISGDIQIQDTIRLIDRYFSAWKAKPLPKPQTWPEPPLRGAERVTVKYEGEEYVLLAFRTARNLARDADALRLCDMVLDNSVAGLINLNLNAQQKVRQAGAGPELLNDYGAEYLFGVPKKGQSLADVEKLLLAQVDLLKAGKFEDWILPAIITDFKKNRKAQLESNVSRVALMRAAFIDHESWDHAVGQIARLEKLRKADVVRAANKYFDGGYVAGYRIDAKPEIPSIEKPQIEKIAIDPRRVSAFFKQVMSMPVKPIEPVFVDPRKDYQEVEVRDGIKLYYAKNPLNDLFSLQLEFDVGTRENNRIAIATQLLNKSGTDRLSAEDLKKEWYKLGTDFGVGAGEAETDVSLGGLDENFAASVGLLHDVLTHPATDPGTLSELAKIILAQREDAKKDFHSISAALVEFNRYGKDSTFLRMLPNDAVEKLTVPELLEWVERLPHYRHTISYTGSLPLERVLAVLRSRYADAGSLEAPPPYRFRVTRAPQTDEILFVDKPMAQAQVRLEFGDTVFNEGEMPAIELFNDYFAGGMAGIVFQELRESRALAYAVGAVYLTGGRKGEQNLMIGGIGCQADKTPEAVHAFIDLMDHMPASPRRFKEAQEAILNRYRTSKLGFREVLGAVRSWERLGVPVDPRQERYATVESAGMDLMLDFYHRHVQGRPKLISIVGDKSKIGLAQLEQGRKVTEVRLSDIFAF
ncbi:MAG: insulinase family protein [Verrucomicrobia bacterium]|nr:insulinase family protein [Verrucomicrobiota bacterium]